MAKNSSKVISGDEPDTYQRWVLPDVSNMKNTVNNASLMSTVNTSAQFESVKKQAYQEGFQKGLKDGTAAGKEEHGKKVQSLGMIIKSLHSPLADLDEQVVNELVTLAITIARHMIRRELKADPGEVIGVVREALGSLPIATRNIHLYLNPEDVTLVKESLSLSGDGESCKIVEDPAMARGGCRIVTESSQVDASIENRLTAIVTQLMGGERENDGNA